MGSLKDMINFLYDTRHTMESILDKLDKLQEHFNRNYNNVIAVRNSEIEFLQKEFFARPESFPAEIRELYNKNLKTQEKIFSENLSAIIKKRDELKSNIDQINKDRIAFSEKLKKSNTTLDAKEEALKKKVEDLEAQTSAYNKTIDELNTGFGFITNFLKMRKIQEEKDEILKKRDELIAQVENIRNKWIEAEKTIGEQDLKIQENWNYIQTEYSITSEKIETLEKNKDELIKKGAFSEALAELQGSEKYLTARVRSKGS
jgi:DNA repair exonuclease SbcCD ATPase subunit